MHRRDLRPWLPLLILTLAVGVLFYRILVGEVLFWGLPALQFYPWRWFAFGELSEGRLPFWNPYNGAGSPLVANYQSAILYPPNWLYVFDIPQMMGIIALLHILWAGWGMWKFTGALEFSTFGRGVSLLCYALGGYTIGRLGSFPTAHTAVWMPWLFWVCLRVLQYQQMRDVGLLALFSGLMLLAGHAQTSWYIFVALGLFALWYGMTLRRDVMGHIQGLLLAAIAVLLGVGIAFWQLGMTLELLQQSQRSGGVSYTELTNLSYAPLRALTLLTPHFYGTPADGSYLTPDTGVYFEDAAYVGFVPLVAVAFAITGWLKWRKFLNVSVHSAFRSVPFWIVLSVVGFILALGYYGPFYHFLYDYVPTFDNFREPVRWLLWPAFGLSILAGIGVQNWSRSQRAFFWSRLAVAGGLGFVVMALLAGRSIENVDADVIEVLVSALIALGCWIATSGILTLTQPNVTPNTSAGYWQLTVLIVIAADLAWASAGLNPTVPDDFYERDLSMSYPQGRLYWFEDYEREVKFDRYFDLGDYRQARDRWTEVRTSLLPNLNILDRIQLFNNFDPLQPRVHRQYVELIEDSGKTSSALLRAAAVGQVYGPVQPDGWASTQQANTWVAPVAPPTVWLVPEMVWAEDDNAAIEAITSPQWNPDQTVILQGEEPVTLAGDSPIGSLVTIAERPMRRQYQVSSEGPAYLVMASTWYPGWSVRVDGEPATLYRANLAFQAVYIPAGGADVVVSYTPQRSGITIIVSVVSLLGTLMLVAWGLFQEPT